MFSSSVAVVRMGCIFSLIDWILASSSSFTENTAYTGGVPTGFLENASGALCHLPGLYFVLNLKELVLSLIFARRWLVMVSSCRSWRIPRRGLWSVETVSLLQPKTNVLACSSAHATA